VLDIYAASEEPIEGVNSQVLVAAMNREGVEYAATSERAIAKVVERAEPNDVILTLGAGSVSQIAPQVLERLGAHHTNLV
jgi:UDP-N-acetylmuramate--alanine ligase